MYTYTIVVSRNETILGFLVISNEENEGKSVKDHGDGTHQIAEDDNLDNVEVENALNIGSGEGENSHSRKLSAKEELQMKVKQIAKELAEEPIQHVRSLDSFFRNYEFNEIAVKFIFINLILSGSASIFKIIRFFHFAQSQDENGDENRSENCRVHKGSEASSEDLNDSFLSAKEDSGDDCFTSS